MTNGERAIFFCNIANVTMDLNEVETITFNALGGAPVIDSDCPELEMESLAARTAILNLMGFKRSQPASGYRVNDSSICPNQLRD